MLFYFIGDGNVCIVGFEVKVYRCVYFYGIYVMWMVLKLGWDMMCGVCFVLLLFFGF